MQVYHKNFIYTILRCFVVNPVINMSLRRLVVKGKENLPKDGAVIIGCNHTSALLDALAILRAQNRATIFMTRADIFRRPLLFKTFTFLKMLPIFRIRDGYAAVKQNEEIISKCVKVLEHHYPLALFPEATHRPKHSLRSLSKGIFHIALEANKAFGHERPVYIVPMGLEYGDYFRYRATVVATYGEPINVTEFVKKHQDTESPARILALLRDELTDRMSKLIAYLPDTDDYDAQWELAELCTAKSHPLSPSERLILNQVAIKRILQKKSSMTAEDTSTLYADALAFKKECAMHGILPSSTGYKRPLLAAIVKSVLLLGCLPYYLFSVLTMCPSWILKLLIVGKVKDKAFHNTARFGVDLFLWPLLVLIGGIVACRALSIVPAIVAIALIVMAIPFFHDYNAFAQRTWSDWQWALNKNLHPRLSKLLKRLKE